MWVKGSRDVGQRVQGCGAKGPGMWGKGSRDVGQRVQGFRVRVSWFRIFGFVSPSRSLGLKVWGIRG